MSDYEETLWRTAWERARAVYGECCGPDYENGRLFGEIFKWLMEGDHGEGRTTTQLVQDWYEECRAWAE